MREAEEESVGIADVGHQIRTRRQFAKHLLQGIAGFGFVAGEVQQEAKQRLGVGIVPVFELPVGGHASASQTHVARRIVYAFSVTSPCLAIQLGGCDPGGLGVDRCGFDVPGLISESQP